MFDLPLTLLSVATVLALLLVAYLSRTLSVKPSASSAMEKGLGKGTLIFAKRERESEQLGDKLHAALARLLNATQDTQDLMQELEGLVESRRRAVESADRRITEMSARERELKERLELYSSVAPEARDALAEIFADELSRQERSGSRRDYMLFAAGFVASTLVSVVQTVLFD